MATSRPGCMFNTVKPSLNVPAVYGNTSSWLHIIFYICFPRAIWRHQLNIQTIFHCAGFDLGCFNVVTFSFAPRWLLTYMRIINDKRCLKAMINIMTWTGHVLCQISWGATKHSTCLATTYTMSILGETLYLFLQLEKFAPKLSCLTNACMCFKAVSHALFYTNVWNYSYYDVLEACCWLFAVHRQYISILLTFCIVQWM